jgi:hypothetical protein
MVASLHDSTTHPSSTRSVVIRRANVLIRRANEVGENIGKRTRLHGIAADVAMLPVEST